MRPAGGGSIALRHPHTQFLSSVLCIQNVALTIHYSQWISQNPSTKGRYLPF